MIQDKSNEQILKGMSAVQVHYKEKYMGAQATEQMPVKETSPVEMACKHTDHTLSYLAEMIGMLENRLSPVLAPSGLDQSGESRPTLDVKVAEIITSFGDRAYAAGKQIEQIMQRLGV